MWRFDFLLSFKEPLVDFPRAQKNVVGVRVKFKSSKSVFGSVADFIENCLNPEVGSCVPHNDTFVGAERDQVIALFIES